MSLGARVGILGGTLDPVHVGHIETALAARDALALDRVLLLPSRIPPHRPLQPSASPFHRFAMAALAVNGIEGVEACDIELVAPGTSYTASTLERFHESGTQPSQIFFILGADAFAEIETWNRYPRVLDMRTIKLTTGARLPLDGDLLTVLETLYHEMTTKRELDRTFEDTVREIQHVIDQLTDDERRQYLSESFFLNFVSYENERLGAYMIGTSGWFSSTMTLSMPSAVSAASRCSTVSTDTASRVRPV